VLLCGRIISERRSKIEIARHTRGRPTGRLAGAFFSAGKIKLTRRGVTGVAAGAGSGSGVKATGGRLTARSGGDGKKSGIGIGDDGRGGTLILSKTGVSSSSSDSTTMVARRLGCQDKLEI
jgi:hypothetical protein